MLEAQALVTLSLFIEVSVLSRYGAVAGMTPSREGSTTCLSKGLQCLLANYAQAKDTTMVVQYVQDTKKSQRRTRSSFPA